jgi:hypothetical protein
LPILIRRTFHSTQFLSLLCLRGLDSLRSSGPLQKPQSFFLVLSQLPLAAAMANAGQAGGAPIPPPPLAYATGAQFNALWDAAVTDQARAALEQEAITRSPLQDVQIAAMLKINLRLQAQVTVGQLAGQVTTA